MCIHVLTIVQLSLLLAVANGAPVIATRIFGDRFSWPLDDGVAFFDGKPLFGKSKSVRGILASVLSSALAAPLLGLPWTIGSRSISIADNAAETAGVSSRKSMS